ncbi:MAG TPA: VCBS repeat-containing protein [Planctomycetota bacterium]|nr:VCBS repeat-containing protein [Planctomycetota bacterium]
MGGWSRFAFGMLLAPVVAAQQVLLEVPTSFPYEIDPVQAVLLGDADGDGVTDVLVADGTFIDSEFGGWQKGRYTARSGADGSVIYVVSGQAPAEALGLALTDMGDLDGDGTGDAFVLAEPFGCFVSGVDGSVLARVTDATSYLYGMVVRVPDVNGDGLDDVLVGAPEDTSAGGGSARLHSGRNGAVLLTLAGDAPLDELGAAVAAPGDLDGDGISDLAIATDRPPGAAPEIVRAYSATTGAVLFELIGGPPFSAFAGDDFGRALGAAGDIDLDGVPDLLVGMAHDTSAEGLGNIRVYSGATGQLVLGVTFEDGSPEAGRLLAGLGDLDGDGWPDFAATHSQSPDYAGSVRLFSGSDGAERARLLGGALSVDFLGLDLRVTPDFDGDGDAELLVASDELVLLVAGAMPAATPVAQTWGGAGKGQLFGAALAGAGDVDGDGRDDVAIGVPEDDSLGPSAGGVRAYAGETGALLWARSGTLPYARLGSAVAAAGDVDGDGRSDVIAGAPALGPAGGLPGHVQLLSGADGSVLREWVGTAAGDGFGAAVAGPGDLDGDNVPDIAVGAPQHFDATTDGGLVLIYSGATGQLLGQLGSTSTGAALGAALSPLGDQDGDGSLDLLAGAPFERVKIGAFSLAAGAVRVLDGSGQVQLMVKGSVKDGSFGAVVAGAGDLDGNGAPDWAAGSPTEGDVLDGVVGRVRAYSGVRELYDFGASEAGADVGRALAAGRDVDGDGVPDVVVPTPETIAQLIQVHVLSGPGGRAASTLGAGGFGLISALSVSLVDVDASGRAEVLLGAPDVGEHTGQVDLYEPSASWEALAPGLAGEAGVPRLDGSGALVSGSLVSVALEHAAPGSPGLLFVGFAEVDAPFLGGVLVPSPDVVAGFITNASGQHAWAAPWPGGLPPGSSMYVQAWILDPSAAEGAAASQALTASVP